LVSQISRNFANHNPLSWFYKKKKVLSLATLHPGLTKNKHGGVLILNNHPIIGVARQSANFVEESQSNEMVVVFLL
ncbi:hypothetical protein, partial [Acinetobacter baumannii]|uniref:hypothetical protein n=1 Tax=Acinetobacter baumannii TaxID=470 RepID=UPI001C07067E